jgi:cell division protein FtsZ
MSIKLQLPKLTDMRPRLAVIGVGGAGCNAVNNMISAGLDGVEFVVANTDAQALAASSAEHTIQLGAALTEGLGAGSKPEIGEAAAEEAVEEIKAQVSGCHMVFVAAGMGGGTGTGAAAVIARTAKELGILTVGVVTKPFQFEGARRMRMAEAGIAELKKHVDTLIVIPNQNLFRLANEKTTFSEAFVLADQVLYSGVACIVDLIIKEGLINLDFADVRTVIAGMGSAMMGTGEADGERRAIIAAEEAIANPLLDDVSLKGAKGLLLSITGSSNLTLFEVDEAASRVREEVDPEANIIVGATFDENLGDRVRVSIVASGMARGYEQAEAVPAWQSQVPAQTTAEPMRPTQSLSEADNTAAAPENSMRDRLSDALKYGAGVGNYADLPVSATPAAPEQQAVAKAAQQPSITPSWSGPGNVTIEDGFPAFAQRPAAHHQQPAPSASSPAYGDPDSFQPASPAPVSGAMRRIPDVNEFPAIAQREYYEKARDLGLNAGEGEARSLPPAKVTSKPGFFERLKNKARGASDSAVEKPDFESRSIDRQGQDKFANHSQVSEERPSEARDEQREDQQPPDLPMFFSRNGR